MTIAASAGSAPTFSAISGIVVVGESHASTISSSTPSADSGSDRTRAIRSSRVAWAASTHSVSVVREDRVSPANGGGDPRPGPPNPYAHGRSMQRIHVALTPRDPAPADVAIVVDCIRATTTIAYALAAGYQEVVCVAEVDEARREAAALGATAVLGGERRGVRIEGFHLGNSPSEYERPLASTLVLTTTNGTRAILQAAAEAEHVLVGSLACLNRVTASALELARGGELAVRCAGVEGEAALDDIYVAGRIVQRAAEQRRTASSSRTAPAPRRPWRRPTRRRSRPCSTRRARASSTAPAWSPTSPAARGSRPSTSHRAWSRSRRAASSSRLDRRPATGRVGSEHGSQGSESRGDDRCRRSGGRRRPRADGLRRRHHHDRGLPRGRAAERSAHPAARRQAGHAG